MRTVPIARWGLVFLVAFCGTARAADAPAVNLVRVPDGGIQPQAAVDEKGAIHLVYFKGEAANGDLFYVRSADGGSTFSAPLRVNSQDGSAIATGTIRGAQLALGRGGRPHVAWNGSNAAQPTGPGKGSNPMLYARLNDRGDAFEPQRNVIAEHYGLDGGGSVAADVAGNVYVAWHAPASRAQKWAEADRRVWVARSTDDGRTFAPETVASDATGACGCCGLRIFAAGDGRLYGLYRSATEMVHRDIYLLSSTAGGFGGRKVAEVTVAQCLMSIASMAASPRGVLAAWETQAQVQWATITGDGAVSNPVAAPGKGNNRKHPTIAGSGDHVLLAWTEGTGWQKGGSLVWQLFDANAQPVGKTATRAGIPVWSFASAVALPDGRFVVLY